MYDEYDASGALIPQSQGGLRIDLTKLGLGILPGYGVATAPDGTLYFNAGQLLVHVDSSGNFLRAQIISLCDPMEDVDVLIVQ